MENIATVVVVETLSDKSKVHNVRINADARYDVPGLTIGALSAAHANSIADALNAGVAWIQAD